jgi:hypothetical protein
MPLNNSPIANSNKAASVSRRLFLCDIEFFLSTEALIYATAPRTNTARFFACQQNQPTG